MFYTDKPIQAKKDDILNRSTFSKQLAQAILSYTRIDNFTIGLYGRWGSGKTSIINMMVEEIKDMTKSLPKDEQPLIVYFNPWNYSDCPQLISQFFKTIQEEIKVDKTNEKLNAVGNALQKYSSIFEYTAYIPVVGPYLTPLKNLFEGLGAHLSENTGDMSLNDQKKKVIDALISQKQKFIVIIDDIDRLNNEQIRLIFQLVNSLAGFPNMVYLLSFDRDVVSRALSMEQNCNGEEYLEKIIQVPFEVPIANKSLISNAFCKMFGDVINDKGFTEVFDRSYWSNVFNACIAPFIKNMRDVNRIINSFEFKYGFFKDEINCIDLIALTTFQVCVPDVYNWIFNNSSGLTGSSLLSGGISGVEQKKNYSKYHEEFSEVFFVDPDIIMKALQTMFPHFCWITGGYLYNDYDSNNELRRKQRIASPDRFTRYFDLSLEEIVFDKKTILRTVRDFNPQQLEGYFELLTEAGTLGDYLYELEAYVPEISKDRRLFFIKELANICTRKICSEGKELFLATITSRAENCIKEIFRAGQKQDNYELLKLWIHDVSIEMLRIVCRVVQAIECGYGRHDANFEPSLQFFIDESYVEDIEIILLSKIKELSKQFCFLDYVGAKDVFLIWRSLEKETFDEYLREMLIKDINVPKYLEYFKLYWHNGKQEGVRFSKSSFDEVITVDEIYKKVMRIKNTEDFTNMEHKLKRNAVAFALWYKKEGKEKQRISIGEIDNEILLWEYKV